jgi:hypothetical protein
MKYRPVSHCVVWILVLQCIGGCLAPHNDASLDLALMKLEDKLDPIPIDPIDQGAIYREVTAACVLDYYRRYGSLKALNQPEILQHLAERKSTVVKYKVVALMLTRLSNNNPSPVDLFYSTILEEYSRARAAGAEQQKKVLSRWGMWLQLDQVDQKAQLPQRE